MSLKTPRKIVTALTPFVLVLALLGGTLLTHTADALPDHATRTTYYSDATYSTAVGHRFVLCNGATGQFGTTSPYFKVYETPCN